MISELDDHGFADTGESRKVAVINDTLWDIESRHPWPFLETEDTAFSLTADDNAPTLPTGFSKMLSFTIPDLALVLQPMRLDTATKSLAGKEDETGIPYLYYFVGSELRIWKTPSETFTAKIRYLQTQTELTAASVETDILLPARHHRLAVLGSLYKLYTMEDDPELARAFLDQYETRLELIREDLFKRQYDRPDRIADVWGSDFDDPDWF